MNLIGDVKGKIAVMVDDMIDTAGKRFIQIFSTMMNALEKFNGDRP